MDRRDYNNEEREVAEGLTSRVAIIRMPRRATVLHLSNLFIINSPLILSSLSNSTLSLSKHILKDMFPHSLFSNSLCSLSLWDISNFLRVFSLSSTTILLTPILTMRKTAVLTMTDVCLSLKCSRQRKKDFSDLRAKGKLKSYREICKIFLS